MAKVNKKEYEVLKSLRDSWKWIARDGESNSLNVFSVKPIKTNIQWNYTDVGYKHAGLTKEENKMFQFIRWEDEEPYNISELVEEYESEETEVKKDLEWLKEEITEILLTSKKDGTNYFYYRDLKEKIYNAIDQLDETEVTFKKEPKYNVKIESSFGTVGIYLFKQGDEVLAGDNFKAYRPKEDEFRLTEHEIRSFQNGDILFEHFAVKVEGV